MIHSGEWQLQQKIPAEPELMARLGVSRGTLREARRGASRTEIGSIMLGGST